MNNIKKTILILFVVFILGFIYYSQNQNKDYQKIKTGTIEGSLSYPSDYIPDNIKICAENIFTKKEYCTSEHAKDKKYVGGIGYVLNVPVGIYYVFANSPTDAPELKDYKAYYSKYVTCGMKTSCLSHDPIQVTVNTGETTEDINPWDWYNSSP